MTNKTPRGNRLHIGIFGRRNAGKSSLINALTGQSIAIVSDEPGTTADPVYKSMELHPIGPVVFIDTAGFDDVGELGSLRVAKAESVISRTDLAIIVVDGSEVAEAIDTVWQKRLADAGIPTITVVNKCDLLDDSDSNTIAAGESPVSASNEAFADAILVSAKTGQGIAVLRKAIEKSVPDDHMQDRLFSGMPSVENLLGDESTVLLVMPQDIQAPKGRLILPQVQTIRELLDRKCTVISTTADGFERALSSLAEAPALIITDSQCFKEVYAKKPADSKLTSFSIIMAAAKGDIDVFVEGASVIDDMLSEDAKTLTFKVLIAEACTHVPINEDIGTVKIPKLLHKMFGERVQIDSVQGNDFPDTKQLEAYDLIIHCGACMFNRRHVMSRIKSAKEAGVPITNYGIFLAKMAGILDNVIY